jgi:hypothetical protein
MSKERKHSSRRQALGLAVLSLAVVATGWAAPAWAQLSRSMARTIGVSVVGGRIVVTEPQAPIALGDTVVTWRLQSAGYGFADDGVVIAGGQDAYGCEVASDRRSYRCSKYTHAAGQRFQYSINLIDLQTSGAAGLPQPYVWIVND